MGSAVAGMFQISKIQSRKRQEISDPKIVERSRPTVTPSNKTRDAESVAQAE